MGVQKDAIAGVFGRAADVYGEVEPRIFSHFGRRLVELADLAPRDTVLDVATGKGAVLFPAAERAAKVVGIDLAAPMVERTASLIRERALDNVEVLVMDAEDLRFPDASFDAVLCGFAIFFLPQPARALSEFRRVLRPGGLVGLSLFGGAAEPRWSWLRELVRVFDPEQMPSERFGREQLEVALGEAGFAAVRFSEETFDGSWADGSEWLRWSWAHGHRRFLERLDEEQLGRFTRNAFAELERAREPDGRIHSLFTAVFGFGVSP